MTNATHDELELSTQDGGILPPSGELRPDSDGSDSEEDENEDLKDDSVYFEREVIYMGIEILS